jgi:hypothetical protein
MGVRFSLRGEHGGVAMLLVHGGRENVWTRAVAERTRTTWLPGVDPNCRATADTFHIPPGGPAHTRPGRARPSATMRFQRAVPQMRDRRDGDSPQSALRRESHVTARASRAGDGGTRAERHYFPYSLSKAT